MSLFLFPGVSWTRTPWAVIKRRDVQERSTQVKDQVMFNKLLLAALAFACLELGKPSAVADQRSEIEGEWTIVALSDGGRKKDPQGATMVFAGDDVTLKRGAHQEKMKFSVDSSKSPPWIDYIETEKKRTSPGIYELKGDDLRICVNGNVEKIKDRPARFASEYRAAHDTLFVLRRVGAANVASSQPPLSLRDAVRAGDAPQVALALQNGADPNVRNQYPTPIVGSRLQEPILCVAAKQGNVEIVRLLLKHQAATEDHSHEGLTPIGVAARYGHREVVRLLCEHKVDVQASPSGRTALSEAFLRGDFETAKLLVAQGALTANPKHTHNIASVWSSTVQRTNVPAVRFLLAHGVDVNQRSAGLTPTSKRNPGGDTALTWTRYEISVVQKRCDHLIGQINGANPNKESLQSSLEYEQKGLAVLKAQEQVLLDAGAKE
ncbi:MAG: hypothetical protein C0483_04955 [Pirellula sp.]|nr:hypothetical protein [Pirellula sp.]